MRSRDPTLKIPGRRPSNGEGQTPQYASPNTMGAASVLSLRPREDVTT